MKKIITGIEYSEFLERFYKFSDAVIRSVDLQFNNDGSRKIDICISARDSKAQENEGWVCVVISVDRVSEVHVHDERQKQSIQVLSNGLHLMKFEKLIGIEFGGAIDAPSSLLELRKSQAYALGEDLSFDVSSY